MKNPPPQTCLNQSYNHIFGVSEEELFRYLINFEIISFDVFDTLLIRTCNEPSMVFHAMENFSKTLNFHDKRTLSEVNARKKIMNYTIVMRLIYLIYMKTLI